MRRVQDVFTVYGSINRSLPDVEMGRAPGFPAEDADPNDLSPLLASKRQIYSGPDGAIAAFNTAMHKKIIKALEGDYSRPLSALGLVGQIWADKGFAVQLITSAILGVLTAYFYIPSALAAGAFIGHDIKWLTIFLQGFFVSAGPGLNCALGCLSIKKQIDVFRDELTDEEAFLSGQINLTTFEKLINNAKTITDVIFAIFATFAPILLGTVGVATLTLQILGAISGVTNLGPNWLGMTSISYPTFAKIVPLRKAQLMEAEYLNEQLRLLTEFPLDDLLAKIYLIREEVSFKEGNKFSEQDYLKLFLHLLQLGKKVDNERKAILLKKYPLSDSSMSKIDSASKSQPLLVEESTYTRTNPINPEGEISNLEKNQLPKNTLEKNGDTVTEPIQAANSSKPTDKNGDLAADPATILYQDPSTKMKTFVKYLLGAISAIAPLGYVLLTKNDTNNTINKEFSTHLAWPGFIAAAGSLLPYLGLGYGAGRGVGEGLTIDGKEFAAIIYPKLYTFLKWLIVILGTGSGGTNAEANYKNFPTGITPPPTTSPGTTQSSGANSTSDFDSQYPSISQVLRYIAGGWGLSACPLTNVFYTLKLVEELLIYVARNCGNAETRLILESMLSIVSIIKLRVQTTLAHYESILKRATTADNGVSSMISKTLRGIFADRLPPDDYFNRDIQNSVGMIIPQLHPMYGEKFESKPKNFYKESPCKTFFTQAQLEGNDIRRRRTATPAVTSTQLIQKP